MKLSRSGRNDQETQAVHPAADDIQQAQVPTPPSVTITHLLCALYLTNYSISPTINVERGKHIMYKKARTLSDAERVRLDEITFCNFITQLFSINSNPTKVYSFVEVVCTLGRCDLLIINSVVSTCMTQDRRYKATKEELMHLYAKSNMPVRKITSLVGLSQRDYYELIKKAPPDIQPKFNPKQYIEIIKFLNCLENLIPERIG